MTNSSFSEREGLRRNTPLIHGDAPYQLRYGVREVLARLDYRTPKAQRRILCGALRTPPETDNWSDYPNVDNEVIELLTLSHWLRFFDALERMPTHLREDEVELYYQEMNALLADESIGYRFESGQLTRVGTDEFHSAVNSARNSLQGDRFAEPRRQFDRANHFRNSFPPDWPNAIKEAVNSVEGTLQVIYNRPGVSLTTIMTDNFPSDVPGGIKQLFRSLYSHGSGTEGARHASIGGNQPTASRAELAIHIAAALHTFAVAELNT